MQVLDIQEIDMVSGGLMPTRDNPDTYQDIPTGGTGGSGTTTNKTGSGEVPPLYSAPVYTYPPVYINPPVYMGGGGGGPIIDPYPVDLY